MTRDVIKLALRERIPLSLTLFKQRQIRIMMSNIHLYLYYFNSGIERSM